jgi:hypothetical protein
MFHVVFLQYQCCASSKVCLPWTVDCCGFIVVVPICSHNYLSWLLSSRLRARTARNFHDLPGAACATLAPHLGWTLWSHWKAQSGISKVRQGLEVSCAACNPYRKTCVLDVPEFPIFLLVQGGCWAGAMVCRGWNKECGEVSSRINLRRKNCLGSRSYWHCIDGLRQSITTSRWTYILGEYLDSTLQPWTWQPIIT